MSSAINPEAGQPARTQAFEQSDRNPWIINLAGDADGGQVTRPKPAESRVTKAGPILSPDAGLTNYDAGYSGDAAEEEGEREG